ncbi:adenylate kinase 7-like [Cydia strobilella]|uniref:adenylate kinase 7-like n=1 Tax=Cydia strobilella TaxID=1100964 RepID=UPI003004A3F8
MNKSRDILSSNSSSELDNQFSYKRYFINNLDSYHGERILELMSKIILERNAEQTWVPSAVMLAEDAEPLPPPPPEIPYEIIGTVTDPKIKSLDNVARIIPKDQVLSDMLTCGTVVLDISYDRDELRIAMDYIALLKDLLEKHGPATAASEPDDEVGAGDSNKRYLVLVSTVMTWAATKPLDPENPEMPFIEADFRKRKPHLNYKIHYDAENEVIGIARKYRTQIGALVVCAGMTYGGREDVLYYWFQKAWECEPFLPILGRGANVVPLINVLDLAQIVYNLVTDFPKKLFILAVEQNVTKQREIVKPLGRCAGTGMFKCIPQEDAFLIPEIDQRIFDLMTLNVSMEPGFIVETMALQWTTELTFDEYAPFLIKEFKKQRGLKPFKIIVYGPPIVGKTTLAKQICENYGLVYISPETAAKDVMEDLARRVAHWDEGETSALPQPSAEEEVAGMDDEEDNAVEDEEAREAVRQELAVMQAGLAVSEEEIMGYMRKRLLCREALNRGWVLDGLPNTIPQCTALFDRGEEQDSDAEEENEEDKFDEDADLYSNVLKKILPDIVVSLEATDDFICDKAMKLPEGDSRLDEEVVLNRLYEFRANDARDVTPLNVFDELDIHPLIVPMKEHSDYAMKGPYAAVALRMGRPCRYSKLLAMIEAAEKKAKEDKAIRRHEEAKAQKELEEKMRKDREDKMEYWSELYAAMRDEEEQALAAAGEPMRNYLVHNIFPTLTPALLEVARLRPADPIDFLAEHLFKQNPTGKMLEPGYNLQAEKILGKIKILDDALQDLDVKIEPLAPPEAELPSPPSPPKPKPMSAL